MDILLVEDNPLDAEAIQRAIAKAQPDAELVVLDDASGVVEAVLARPFDCIMLDYLLPSGTGLGILRRLHAGIGKDSTPPVIMLSGLQSQLLNDTAESLGVADFVEKDTLDAERVQQALDRVARMHKVCSDGTMEPSS